MTRSLALVILLYFAFNFSLGAQSYNAFDAQGLRHGSWQKSYEGTAQLRYEGTFNHGKEIDTFKFYDKSGGHPTGIKTYTPGRELVDVKFYTKSGTKISEGTLRGRLKEGEWLYYHKNGTAIMTREVYLNDALEGIRTVYFPDGKKAQETTYKNGLKEGRDIHYNETGTVLKEYMYVNDLLEGPVKLYDYDGRLLREGQYKANRKHGTWKYYVDGTFEKTVKFPQNKIGVQH